MALVRLLIATSAGLLAALLVTVVYFTFFTSRARGRFEVSKLTSVERERLVEGILADSPGVHQWAYFEPRIAYTLRPDSDIEAWHDRFHSNRLGYRAPAIAKSAHTFRVVFVGDSWTYGMGIRRDQAFPAVIERLGNAPAGAEQPAGRRIESWPLALPGYNLFNSLSALGTFWSQLEPDAIVIVPSDNDHHSSVVVLPNGSLWGGATTTDDFGAPHVTSHDLSWVGSFEADRRWQAVSDSVADTTRRARSAGVPVAVLFVARWPLAAAHAFMSSAGLDVPYAVVDPRLTMGEWENPPPELHGTPAANELYGELGYELLATTLGWKRQSSAQATRAGAVFTEVPPESTWRRARVELREQHSSQIAETFDPRDADLEATAGQVDFPTGAIPRATTLLVRRQRAASTLTVTIGKLAESSLYPMEVRIRLPSRAGGSEVHRVLEAQDPDIVTVALPIPADISPGDVMDVVIEAERAISQRESGRTPRSMRIVRIDQD